VGLMDRLVKISSSKIGRKGSAPGDAVICQAEATKGDVLTAELYQQPGIYSAPPKGARGIFVPVGGSRKYGVIIATHNYELNIQVAEGETTIYSTTVDGKTIKALISLDGEGNIDFNGNSKRLVTHGELNTALQNMVTWINAHMHATAATGPPVAPTPPLLTLDISAAETQTVRTGG